jgi:hypothetical protein
MRQPRPPRGCRAIGKKRIKKIEDFSFTHILITIGTFTGRPNSETILKKENDLIKYTINTFQISNVRSLKSQD